MVKTQKSSAKVTTRQSPGNGKTPEQLVRAANIWRDFYNALRGMTLAKVVRLIEQGQYGDNAELQLLNDKVERRYPVLKGLKARTQSAVGKISKTWDVKVMTTLPEGATEAMALKQQQFLKQRYNLIKNLRQAVRFLTLSDFRGYAILQKRRFEGGRNDGAVCELYWLPQDQFARDGKYGDWFWNEKSMFGATGSTLGEVNRLGGDGMPLNDFIIRESESPLYEISLVAFINWLMGRKDWAAFTEIFGLPNGVAIMPQNIPTGEEERYRIAAEKIAEGVSGALPFGSDIKFPTSGVRNNGPFKEFCDANDEDVVLAGTGGKLSMLTAATGIGKGPTDEHADAFDEIAVEVTEDISEVFQRQFDAIELAAEFPNEPVCVYFQIAPADEEDAGEVADTVVKLEGVGLQTDAEEISERTGLKLTRVAAPKNPAAQKDVSAEIGDAIKNRLAKILNRAAAAVGDVSPALREKFIQATATDLAPIIQAARGEAVAIAQITDVKLKAAKTAALLEKIDALTADILLAPASAEPLAEVIVEGLKQGAE